MGDAEGGEGGFDSPGGGRGSTGVEKREGVGNVEERFCSSSSNLFFSLLGARGASFATGMVRLAGDEDEEAKAEGGGQRPGTDGFAGRGRLA